MTGLAELEQRVSALEEAQRRERVAHAADMTSVKRDLRTLIENQDRVLAQLDDLSRRVAANELTATANARITEKGFAELLARIERLEARFDHFETDNASFRRELPHMIAETMREVLRESRATS